MGGPLQAAETGSGNKDFSGAVPISRPHPNGLIIGVQLARAACALVQSASCRLDPVLFGPAIVDLCLDPLHLHVNLLR